MLIKKHIKITIIAFAALALNACTSLGHEDRAIPKIAKPTEHMSEIGFDSDDNELSIALDTYLSNLGIRPKILSAPQVRLQKGEKEYTYDEVQTRYVVRVRSIDLDTCMPEGSRQMHFSISVTDYQERTRVFVMNGEFGCRDTIVKTFGKWLSQHNQTKP